VGCAGWCDDCYGRHTQARRLAILRLCLHLTTEELRLAWAHFWPQTEAGDKLLYRDRKALKQARNDAASFSVDRPI
jgi:hypothetical protein